MFGCVIFERSLQVTVRSMLRNRFLSCLPVCSVGVLWMSQDATWHGGRVRSRRHCLRRGPSSFSRERGTAAPRHFSAHVYCGKTVAHQQLLSSCRDMRRYASRQTDLSQYFAFPPGEVIIQLVKIGRAREWGMHVMVVDHRSIMRISRILKL